MKKNLLFILGTILCLGCSGNSQQETPAQDPEGFSELIEVQTNRSVTLMPAAQQEISQWLAYATAQNEIEGMKSATGKQIMENSQPLVQIMESLENTLPDTLKVVPVQSRTTVLLTKARVLHQLSSKKEKNTEEIFKAANDLIIEFDNFKLQLNERFLKSPQEFELELDREFEESRNRDTTTTSPVTVQ